MSIPPYVFDESHEVVRDFSAFSGVPVGVLEERLNDFRGLTRDEWERNPGATWEQKAETYYVTAKSYVFDLLRSNYSRAAVAEKLDRFEPRILSSIRRNPGGSFLEFGGGTGVVCQIAAEMGKDVTYVDLPGAAFEFAAWRFRRLGLPVTMIEATPTGVELPRAYDVVFSDAVFEHLIDPVGAARTLAAHLRPSGFLGLLVDLDGENPDLPMHRPVDLRAVHGALEGEGLAPEFGSGTFVSGWSRPAVSAGRAA